MLNKLLSCLWLLQICAFVSSVSAQPQVDTVEGSWANDVSITVRGVNFGSKVPAAPVLWDPVGGQPAYSGMQNGDAVPVQRDGDCPDCPWPNRLYTDQVYYYTEGTGLRVPGRAVYRVNKAGGFTGVDLDLDGTGQVMYVNWWVMATRNLSNQGSGLVFNKLLRAWVGGSGTVGRTSWEAQMTMFWSHAGDIASHVETNNNYPGILTDNVWSNVEATIFSQNLDINGGGRLTLDVDNTNVLSTGNLVASSGGPYDYVQAIGSSPHDPSRYADDTFVYWGDVYIDNTIARVVVGDAPVFTSCRHLEIQIPTAWSPSSVAVQVNRGSFEPASPAWLFVLDANGQVNADGFVLTNPGVLPGVPGQPVR